MDNGAREDGGRGRGKDDAELLGSPMSPCAHIARGASWGGGVDGWVWGLGVRLYIASVQTLPESGLAVLCRWLQWPLLFWPILRDCSSTVLRLLAIHTKEQVKLIACWCRLEALDSYPEKRTNSCCHSPGCLGVRVWIMLSPKLPGWPILSFLSFWNLYGSCISDSFDVLDIVLPF